MTRPPSQGAWTDTYGPRINPITRRSETHHGLDINAAAGLILVAPEPCTLTHWGPVSGWSVQGNVAILQGESGYTHWLAHTAHLVLDRNVGDRLAEDDPVALMGMSGQTTGLHVHWETRLGTARLDPAAWLARPANTGPTPLQENEMTQPFVKVTREDKPLFAVVSLGGNPGAPVPLHEEALVGVDKILAAFGKDGPVPTVTLSGAEWDAGALAAFGVK